MSEEKQKGFKRLHFFKMFLTEDDWNDRHLFHIKKQQLLTLAMHGWGIVPNYQDELLVRQRPRPELAMDVGPGYAVDQDGEDAILYETVSLRFERTDFYLPCTIYVVLRYAPEPVDLVRFKDGSRRNKFFAERAKIELVARPPQPGELELARVRLSTDVYKITDARNPDDPQENEIDLRYRRYAAVFQVLDLELKRQLLGAIRARRFHYLRIGGNKLLRPAATLAHCMGILELVVQADLVSPRSAVDLLEAITMLDDMLGSLVKDAIDDPWATQRPDWLGFTRNVDLVRSLLNGPMHYQLRNLEQIISFLGKSVGFLPGMTNLYGNESLVYYPGQQPVLAREYPLSHDWERIKTWSADFPPVLYVDGMEWRLVGELNITDEKDEKKYKFRIHNALDAWRTRQRLSYPDGTEVDDTGVAHEGGYAEYEVRGVVPDTHLAVIRMMDYARADFELEFVVNEQLVGVSQCVGNDRRARWRNWPFVIPAWFVNDDTLRIKQLMTTAERDVNMFRFWFYQPFEF